MSIQMEDHSSTGVRLEAETCIGKTRNGRLKQDSPEDIEKPISSSEDTKQKRRTKWTSVRNAINVTSVVKKPMTGKKKTSVTRQDSFLKRFSTRQHYRTDSDESIDAEDESPEVVFVPSNITVFKPDGSLMFYWLLFVTIAVLYNLWTCIVRQAFRELQYDERFMWITFDILFDIIYILDIVVQLRTGYLEQGLMVFDTVKLAKQYLGSIYFKMDIISLLPLDFIQFAIGWQPLLRFPRFLKVHRSLRFLYMLETRTAYPNFVRVANLTHMLFLGCHWFASFYYMISEAESFHGEWTYPVPIGNFSELTRKYLVSLFWSTLTLTTIGDLPPPETNWEYLFVICSYLIGVFIFATIVGQVGNVITNRNASRLEFERLLDGAKLYMRMHNVPPPVQRRVQRWYDYVWTRGRMSGSDINSLGLLPDKLKTELAIHVNLETLKKVSIFNECQPEFLHDLVLKMKAYIFTPGDLICRRGEVAREMFIIADGVVEIISESGSVLTQMSTGNFFGEIGILNLDGGINRRTADVKSVGYAELFVLSREDVLEALKDHPDAKEIIRKYAEQRLKQVLQDRKKLQETRSASDNTINQLLIYPRQTLLCSSVSRKNSASTCSIKRKTSVSKLNKLFRRSGKFKSKYRVGTADEIKPSLHDNANDQSSMQAIDGSHLDVSSCINETGSQKVRNSNTQIKSDNTSNCLSAIPLVTINSHVTSALTNNVECNCDNSETNIDRLSLNEDIQETCDKEKSEHSCDSDDYSFSLQREENKELEVLEKQQQETVCCRCGHLELKLLQIEKQLISVERLYTEGIKQLETFNVINEKYIQLLNTIPDPNEKHEESNNSDREIQTTKF